MCRDSAQKAVTCKYFGVLDHLVRIGYAIQVSYVWGCRGHGARACNKDCVLDGAYPNLQRWGA